MQEIEPKLARSEQHRQLQQQYRELLEKYQAVLHRRSSPHLLGIWLLRHARDGVALVRNGALTRANRRFHALCRAGSRWTCVSHPDAPRDPLLSQELVLLAAGLPPPEQGGHTRIFRAVGPAPVFLEARLERLADEPEICVIVLRDVTESVSLRREREESEQRDRFLATLAHELRNPLAPILSSAELILQRPTDPEVRRAAAVIARQARHQSRLVEDLRDAARVRHGKVLLQTQLLDLRDVAREAVGATRDAREARGIHLRLHLCEESLWVRGDVSRLVQCVVNLLSNAARYTSAGGENRLSLEASDNLAWLRVRDNGIGIIPELLPQIFELFTQGELPSDRCDGGLGIGLALVRSLVGLHEGGVTAVSEGSGAGSEFTLWLPLACAPAAGGPVPRAKAASPPAGPRPGRRILLVEDNANAREILAALLEAWGYEVLRAAGAEEALATALRERPRVIISDIGLPGMDGFELCARLRPSLPESTFITLSGYSLPEDRARARDAGFDAYLVKPVDSVTLLRELEEDGE